MKYKIHRHFDRALEKVSFSIKGPRCTFRTETKDDALWIVRDLRNQDCILARAAIAKARGEEERS